MTVTPKNEGLSRFFTHFTKLFFFYLSKIADLYDINSSEIYYNVICVPKYTTGTQYFKQ